MSFYASKEFRSREKEFFSAPGKCSKYALFQKVDRPRYFKYLVHTVWESYWLLEYERSKVKHMGREISKYYGDLAKRIEGVRKQQGKSQEQMAAIMGVNIAQYKRYMYSTARIPAERVALLVDALDLDAAYILNGENSSAYDCVKIIGTASNNEVADMLSAMAKTLRTRETNITRIDYQTKEGIVVETRRKKK